MGQWVLVGLMLSLNLGPGPPRATGTQDKWMDILRVFDPPMFGSQAGAGP